MARLTWSGNLRAQSAADAAFKKLKPKRKRKTKKQRRLARLHKAARRRALKKSGAEPRQKFVDYAKYIQSPAWKRRRSAALARANHTCVKCGSHLQLHVHHLTYARLGREKPEDLEVLCKTCHCEAHFGDPFAPVDWDSLDIAPSA